MLRITYKDANGVNRVAYVNPDAIVYISGNDNGTTYIKLRDEAYLFALENYLEIKSELETLYG